MSSGDLIKPCLIFSKALSQSKVFNGYGTDIIGLSALSILNIDLA
jgi:hypothetical protein